MNFDKKAIISASSVIVFSLVLGLSSAALLGVSKNNTEYTILSSAGVNGAIAQPYTNVAGVFGAADATVNIVGSAGSVVASPNYNKFGYTNLGLAKVDGNLNVREGASTTAKVVGKLTNYSACEILGEENGFYQITSGTVKGYVSKDYIITGEEALKIAQTQAQTVAKVTTEVLNVRKAASTDSEIITSVNKDEEVLVIEELDGWVKVEVNSMEGYVAVDYVEVSVKLKTGNTLKELYYGQGVSDTRVELVNFALQFVGNRYVWGGESLTNGVDCSGFTMKIYEKYGVYLPHYSGSQPAYGKTITKAELKPGDLIFYGDNGVINHVAIYIGNGQIVHAASTRSGIIISNAFYRTPMCYRSYLK